jgi:hypothetical protein
MDGQSEWDTALTIQRAVHEIREAMLTSKPFRRRDGLAIVDVHDLRGMVIDVPGLAVVMSTAVGLRAGVAPQPPGSAFRYCMVVPNLLLKSLNDGYIQSQSVIHHEITHILHGDAEYGMPPPPRRGTAYFNHPPEICAFTQQALGRMAQGKNFRWDNEDGHDALGASDAEFVASVVPWFERKFLDNLTPANRMVVDEKLRAFRDGGLRHFARLAEADGPDAEGSFNLRM